MIQKLGKHFVGELASLIRNHRGCAEAVGSSHLPDRLFYPSQDRRTQRPYLATSGRIGFTVTLETHHYTPVSGWLVIVLGRFASAAWVHGEVSSEFSNAWRTQHDSGLMLEHN